MDRFQFVSFVICNTIVSTAQILGRWAKSTLVLVPLFGVHYAIFLGMGMVSHLQVEIAWLSCDQLFASFQLFEEEKKAREFHAKPVPASVINSAALSANSVQLSVSATKPVLFDTEIEKCVQPRLEQFKQKVMEEEKILEQMAHFKARPATVILKKPFEPKKSDRPLTDVTAVELNTEKRAKERQVFDLKVKLEQEKLEELQKQREEKRQVKEKEEVALLRKETVHKANPVRHYKKFQIQKSDKLLTDPLSPTFFNRKK